MPIKNAEDRAASQRRYAKKYPDRIKKTRDKHYQKQRKERKLIQYWIEDNFKSVPCMDCNKVWPLCAMDFDHRPEELKSIGISRFNLWALTSKNIATVMKEIDKCDYVCAGCHRVRTWERNRS